MRTGELLDRSGRTSRALRQLVALAPQLPADMFFSHQSAALLHGWPLLRVPAYIHITQGPGAVARGRSDVVRHHLDLPLIDRTWIDEVPVTTPLRTALDCARSFTPPAGVALLDSALRSGVQRAELRRRMNALSGYPGITCARALLGFADARAASAQESVARYRIFEAGLPAPAVQYDVLTPVGSVRVDMAWPQEALGLDVISAPRPRTPSDQALESAGWRIVRLGWSDITSAQRVRQALAYHHVRPAA